MPRPPLGLGKHGKITVSENGPPFVADCRYRRLDGKTVRVKRWGSSKTAARNSLQDALAGMRGPQDGPLKPHDRFSRAAKLWLAKIDAQVADGSLAATTRDRYKHRLDKIVLPALGELLLRECTTGYLDDWFTDLAPGYAADTRRGVRTVVQGVLKLAVKHEAIPANPARELDEIRGRAPSPRVLGDEDRRKWLEFLDSDKLARQRDLPDLTRFMLGTGMRIGEALAVRWCDLDLEGVPVLNGEQMQLVPIVAVTGNIVHVDGVGLVRSTGKTENALRLVPLPQFVVRMLEARTRNGDEDPVFPVVRRDGSLGWKSSSNVTTYIRQARKKAGWGWELTSHHYRKTAATIWHDAGVLTDRQIADLTGHARIATLQNVYIARGELNPAGAAILDAAWMDS